MNSDASYVLDRLQTNLLVRKEKSLKEYKCALSMSDLVVDKEKACVKPLCEYMDKHPDQYLHRLIRVNKSHHMHNQCLSAML